MHPGSATFHHPSEFVGFKSPPHLPEVKLYSARLADRAFAPHGHDGYSLIRGSAASLWPFIFPGRSAITY